MRHPKLPRVTGKYGAPMGRSSTVVDTDIPVKFYLYRMPMVDYNYDNGGAYWGGGDRIIGWMYHAYGDGPTFRNECFVRAASRAKAKEEVKELFPNATFYR